MDSEIKAFYKGVTVLITGATGLIGQLLVEKLLRECPDINGIYLIVRRKKGTGALERMLTALENPVFDKLREASPDFQNKIHVLEGDCSQPKLGLETSSIEVLMEKINIIFHCAGNLSMEAKLVDAVDSNIRALMELLDLCHNMSNLKAVMFVSTAYSQCTNKTVEEKFYKPPLRPETIIKLTEEADGMVLENITPGLIADLPNTYCYSKAITEELISKNIGILPVGLFRPSIVLSTYLEPMPGWTSNLYGPLAFFLAIGLGIMRVVYCNPNGKLNFVPADFCVNALICTAWETHINFKSSSSQTPIYNYSAGRNQNVTMNYMFGTVVRSKVPFKNMIWARNASYIQYKPLVLFMQMLLHYLPGYLADFLSLITGKNARIIKYQKKISKLSNILSFFSLREWNIKNDNIERLWTRLNESDKKLFPFNMDVVDYESFLNNCILGIKLYILNESLENIDKEKTRYQRLVKLDRTIKLLLNFLLIILFLCFWRYFVA